MTVTKTDAGVELLALADALKSGKLTLVWCLDLGAVDAIEPQIEAVEAALRLAASPEAGTERSEDGMVAVRTIHTLNDTADMDAQFLVDHLDSVIRQEWPDVIKSFRRQIIAVAAETAALRVETPAVEENTQVDRCAHSILRRLCTVCASLPASGNGK